MQANRPEITLPRLKQIIEDELVEMAAKPSVREAVDHVSIRDVVNAAAKLLAAIEAFEEGAPVAAMAAVGSFLEQAKKSLEDMVSTPGSYAPKKPSQRVSLKPAKKS